MMLLLGFGIGCILWLIIIGGLELWAWATRSTGCGSGARCSR